MNSELKELLLKDGLVLGHQIGKGSFGTVYQCTDVRTQISYAVKLVDLRLLRMQPHFVFDRIKRECSVLEKLTHPSIVRLFKTIQAPDAMLMVMEMVVGMELFELIVAVSGMKEVEASAVFVQIASALLYMHSKGIIHRDVKPENILLQASTCVSSTENAFDKLHPRVKLVDFGLSKDLGSDDNLSMAKSLVGTPRYVAPEIVELGEKMRAAQRLGKKLEMDETMSYTSKVDCFSVGVLLHVMIAACFPQFEQNKVIFSDPRIAKASNEVKDLIQELMKTDPKERSSMRRALEHTWVMNHHKAAAISVLRSAPLNFEEFEAKVLSGEPVEQMYEGDVYLEREESMEEIDIDESSILGFKRTMTHPRTHSISQMGSVEEELTLPGAQAGVWGPYSANRTRTESTQSVSNFENSVMTPQSNSTITQYSKAAPRFTQQDLQLLVNLQEQIASCFQSAFEAFKNDDVIAPGIESSAIGSRELLRASDNVLHKLGNTSLSVLELLPDMEIAVEEGEFGMAKDCFETIKTWIKELQHESQDLMKANVKVIASVNNTLQTARRKYVKSEATAAGYRVADALARKTTPENSNSPSNSFFDNITPPPLQRQGSVPVSGTGRGAVEAAEEGALASAFALEKESLEIEEERLNSLENQLDLDASSDDSLAFADIKLAIKQRRPLDNKQVTMLLAMLDPTKDVSMSVTSLVQRPKCTDMEIDMIEPISKALEKLCQIDGLLQRHAEFWSKMEVVVDVLMQRANHVESMVSYTQNPRLRGRFIQRVKEYESLWKGLVGLSNENSRARSISNSGAMYKFLTG